MYSEWSVGDPRCMYSGWSVRDPRCVYSWWSVGGPGQHQHVCTVSSTSVLYIQDMCTVDGESKACAMYGGLDIQNTRSERNISCDDC